MRYPERRPLDGRGQVIARRPLAGRPAEGSGLASDARAGRCQSEHFEVALPHLPLLAGAGEVATPGPPGPPAAEPVGPRRPRHTATPKPHQPTLQRRPRRRRLAGPEPCRCRRPHHTRRARGVAVPKRMARLVHHQRAGLPPRSRIEIAAVKPDPTARAAADAVTTRHIRPVKATRPNPSHPDPGPTASTEIRVRHPDHRAHLRTVSRPRPRRPHQPQSQSGKGDSDSDRRGPHRPIPPSRSGEAVVESGRRAGFNGVILQDPRGRRSAARARAAPPSTTAAAVGGLPGMSRGPGISDHLGAVFRPP